MYIIIIGCGRVGSQLASMLAHEKHDIVVIDKDPNASKNLGATFNRGEVGALHHLIIDQVFAL